MSAGSCIIFYGLRFEIASGEIEALETRSDPRLAAARKAGLKSYWGNFGAPGERYVLFVGAQVGILGPENQLDVQISATELESISASVRTKLTAAGIDGAPMLYAQWQSDD